MLDQMIHRLSESRVPNEMAGPSNENHFRARRQTVRLIGFSLAAPLATGSLGLTGCASRSGNAEPEPDPVPPKIETLSVLPVAMPEAISVTNRGAQFGLTALFGALGAPTAFNGKQFSAQLMKDLQERHVDLGERMRTTVMRSLESEPVVLSQYDSAAKTAAARKADDLKLLEVPVDAVLDLSISDLGFYSAVGFDDYTPQVSASMAVRSPKTNEYIDSASYAFNRSPANGYQRHFQTTSEWTFANSEALKTQPDRIAQAFETGVDLIAGAIAVDVRRILSGKFLE